MSMFCYQCEQTAQGTGCTRHGVCGKNPEVAALQDVLVHALKGLSQVAHAARQVGVRDGAADVFVAEGLFATLTNVNFDAADFQGFIKKAVALREALKQRCRESGKAIPAHHYSMTGEFARELWYDKSRVLVKMSLTGKDDSKIDYVLR